MWMTTARRGRGAALQRLGVLGALLVAAVLATGCVQVQAADSGFVMGGNIVISEGEVARDDVVAVGGNVRIDGRATRDVVVVGGRLVINGEAERNVSCVGGTLVLGPRARVGRDVVVVGGHLERSDSARIGGEVVNVTVGPMQWVTPSWGGWWRYNPFAWIFRTTQLFYWLLFALVTVALVGDRVSSTSHAISREPLRMGAIGLVALFALFFGFLILLLMSFLIIGIPFLLALIMLWLVAYIFGVVAAFQSVGSRVMRLVGRPEASQIAIVLAGGLVMGILRYMPVFGGLLWFVASLVGLGAVFATRFGTGRPWLRRAVPQSHYAPPAPEPAPPSPEPPASGGPEQFDEPAVEADEPVSYEEPAQDEGAPEDGETR
jgi:hypothetical protein